MATAKTGSFYLTETVILAAATPSGTMTTGEIDLGAYVNVPTGQAIAVESVDFIYQGTNNGGDISQMLSGNGCISAMLTDLNPGNLLVRADDQSLVASSSLNIDVANSIGTHVSDVYPDNFGPAALSEAFMVVNDTMYLTAGPIGGAGVTIGTETYLTARVKCRVVKLSTKDWMAIAIQSTAADN